MLNNEQIETNYSYHGIPKDAINRANDVLNGVNVLKETGNALDADRAATAARLERDDARDQANLVAKQNLGITSVEHATSNVVQMPNQEQAPIPTPVEQHVAA